MRRLWQNTTDIFTGRVSSMKAEIREENADDESLLEFRCTYKQQRLLK